MKKRAEERMGESGSGYRRLLEKMSGGFSVVDENQVRTYANKKLCEMLGCVPSEIVGRPETDFLDEANRRVAKEQFARRKRGESGSYELTFTSKDGRKVPTILSAKPIINAKGDFRGAFAVIIDITGLKRTQEGLEKAREELETRLREQGTDLGKANEALQAQIVERKRAEEDLQRARGELERRVKARTAELLRMQGQLRKAVKYLSVHKKRLRSLASQHSIAEERERRKFAVYLHDNICQSLGAVKMKLDALQKTISSPDLASALDEISQRVKSTIQDVRSVMVDLSPPVLHELGFEAALEWLAEQFHEQNAISCTFENDGQPKPLHDDVGILLFQSVRELLVNVAKHAQASSAKICALREGNNIRIIVEDDGVGFKTSKMASSMVVSSGFGFFSIRERLSSIDGYMEIKSRPGKGSRVTLVAPLKG